MTAQEIRRQIKKAIDRVPPDRLRSLADYVAFLTRPTFLERLQEAERDIAAGKCVNWREVRGDVP